MNQKKLITRTLSLLLVALIFTSCASATPAATQAACPTSAPLSCPTTQAEIQPAVNDWRMGFSDLANVVITFDTGDKCTLDVKNSVFDPAWSYEIIVNDQTYQNYIVSVVQLGVGKTLKDLEEYNKPNPVEPPGWSYMRTLEIVQPNSSTFHGITLSGTPAYFVCLVQGPGDQKVIGNLGPVKIKE